ncbi:MAG TPA: PSD1 and planctomycete cytochrome C domain-containing protein [Candidatus Saccharimonadales bacterium]|nr:PSD1 and planctomycete cytochrome C domain-containing protein [Candidatus Saccharimonadales bacterium]
MLKNLKLIGHFWVLSLGLSGALAASKPAASSGTVDFSREIRPILSENCFACHGPDEGQRKAKLRFDLQEEAFKPAKSGDFAIVPGDLHKSKLVERISTKDSDDIMPPTKTGKKLTTAQIDFLTRWIKEGAKWQSHWSFVAPRKAPLPQIKNKDWPKNEIDHFVAARLEKEKLKPAPEADKTTLIRRASMDVRGLPPSPQEIDTFLADKTPQAYEKLVDRLLDSPDYGENMARYWLDAARYADSHGYHIDSERSMWKWRDWVVDAYNNNMPFDEFTLEQLAGDLLPEASMSQKIASGYVRCNMSSGEGGAITEEYQAKYTFDRVETTSTIWLGLTLTCARCHTHKYDPILNKEYYGMFALFNSLNESVMDGNKPNPDPFIKVPTPEQTARQAELKQLVAANEKKLEIPMPELDKAQLAWASEWRGKFTSGWSTLSSTNFKSTNAVAFQVLEDQSILVTGANPEKDVYEARLPLQPGLLAALRLEALPHDSLPKKSASRADDGGFRLSELEAEIVYPEKKSASILEGVAAPEKTAADDKGTTALTSTDAAKPKKEKKPPAKPQKIKFAQALADSSKDATTDAAKAIDGKPETGWQADPAAISEPHAALFLPAEPLTIKSNAQLHVRLRYEASTSKRAIGHFRLSVAQNPDLVQLLSPPKQEPWQVIGPFKTTDQTAGFAQVYEPEKEIDLKKTYPGVREEISWKAKPEFEDGKNNMLVQDLHGIHGAYYLYRTIKVPADRKMDVDITADDFFKLWVNGKQLAERAYKPKPAERAYKVSVDLKKGENKILLKFVTQQGESYFTFRKDLGNEDAVPADIAALFAATKTFNSAQKTKVRNYFRRQQSPEFKETFDKLEKWKEEDASIEKSIPTTMVAKDLEKPRETFMLMRGEYDKKGDKVQPGVPSILPPWPVGMPTNRLGFAKWLLSPEHPLTARVTVNRLWQQFFGVGLVKTTEDFGAQGEQPSHPELLDWLAVDFREHNWNVKRLQRMILTSAAYRQSSRLTPELLAKDPENRLLARGPRYRLDAEVLRDTALAVGGLLSEKQGGHSVKPYEPPGLWEAVSFNNSQKYVPDKGESLYRRSLYTYWKRQSPPPNMLIFDAPTREYCVVRRPRTNTPLQALVLLNDPQFVEASRAFGQRMMLEGGKTVESRIIYGFRLATSRKPAADELKILSDIYKQQLEAYQKDKASAEKLLKIGSFQQEPTLDKSELATWATIATMLLNLDEAVTKA